ncbi:MAG: hypothetical protein KOO62_08530 [candidate division Zixibacteria bacterium]|nr:hypothetical protein [candidate division Zixibacteria bacterium]
MSYTNVQLVSHHLATAFPVYGAVRDQPVVLDTDEYVSFFSGAVEESSLRVKSVQSVSPERVSITLASGTNSLTAGPLKRGSIVVASDSSLGTVFVENVDYVVDYGSGDLFIKTDGALSVSDSVVVWYIPFVTYVTGSDFQVRARLGQLRRLSGGNIAAGETMFLDYEPVYQSHNEEILNSAVLEANGQIEREVDPSGAFGADPVLQAAATYRALAIVCHASAARELSSMRGEDRSAVAWIKLAEVFAEQSGRLVREFRPPFDGPNGPVHS